MEIEFKSNKKMKVAQINEQGQKAFSNLTQKGRNVVKHVTFLIIRINRIIMLWKIDCFHIWPTYVDLPLLS